MMSRRFSDAQNYYQRMKELQEKLKQSEDERMRLEKKFNKILQTVRAEDRIRKLSSAKDNYLQLLDEDRMRSDRNDSLMQILDRIENRACSINAKTERLRLLRKHYEAYMERTYPGWKANESKFYESYNEKLKAINSHFRTLSNDYTDLPTWRTSQDIDISRDDVSSASAYSVVNFPQTSYLNTSSFNVSDQTGAKSSNTTNSDSQPTIYNNYKYSQPSREPSIQAPTFSSYKDVSNLGKGTSFKSSNYSLNNLTNPIKTTFSTSYSKPASIVSDFDSEAFQLNNDVNNSRTRQSDIDIDKDFNTKPDYYTSDLLDRTVNNSQINSYSPRLSRYDSSRQPLKYSYNQISPVEKFSNKYSRPSSYDKNYTPRSLTRSSSLDTFTTKYSPRYRYQHTSPSSYSGDKLFRSNSLGRIPQETRMSYPGAHDYGGGHYRKYSPRSRFSERKNYSTLSPMSTTNRIPSDAGYFSHRSTSPANSSTYSSYNTAGYSYNRYNNTPRLTRNNSFQKNYDPPYTATAPRRSVTSNLPYMSTLSRSQSFSEIDDLDYLSRKKNYDMSGWNQYPMGRERFYYDSRNSNQQPVNSYSNQYQPAYSPEPSYTTKSYSFQADKSTSTDDGYDEDRAVYGRRMNRVHYADDIDLSNNSGPTLNYNDYTTERLLDNNKKTFGRDLNAQNPINEFGKSTVGASEKTLSSQSTGIHDRKKLSTNDEPDRASSNELKSPTALPYSQQILQTLEERTEEDITQSTSENPSLGSEQHWENEIGKLKDIMNYDSQPDKNASGYGKDHDISTEQPYRDYYNKSSQSPRQSPKDDQTGVLDKTKENSQFPDLKQEIEMLKKKNQTTIDDRNGFKQDGEMTHSNSASDYQPNGSVIPNEQYPIQPPYYPNSEYDAYTSGNIPQEQKVPTNYHPHPTEYITDNKDSRVTQRVSPSHLEESQVLEKQDQPEKYDKKYNDMGGSSRELNKSPVDYPPRQISPILQSRDSKEYAQGRQNEKQAILPHQESTTGYLMGIGQEQISPRNLQTNSDKSPLQSQYNIDNSKNDNELGNTNITQPPKAVKQETAIDNSQDEKISKINPPTLQKRNSSIGMSQNIPGLDILNKKSSLLTQPEEKTRITSDNGSPLQLANVQSTTVNNQNVMKKENAAVKYDQTQPSLQTMHDNKENMDTVQEHHNTPNISQNYQPQQQSYKNGDQQMQPIRLDESKEHIQQSPTQTTQQLDETSSQQPVIQKQQQYDQPQYQNYAESEQDHYNYNAPGGDDYQPQYDNANAYQYNVDQLAQQFPDNQQYQEPHYPQQEQYPQTQDGQYPKTQDDQYNPQQHEGQYPPQHEGQYPQQEEGQYPQQEEGQYPQQEEGQYPQQIEGQYPQQEEGQYPQQQEGQYPQQQEGKYPQQQDIEYAQQQGDQYPQSQEYQQKPIGNYPSQPDQQYPGDKTASDQIPIDRKYPEGEMPEQFSGNPNEQQYHEQPYSGEQMPQQYTQGQNQQPYQDGQYRQQYDDGQMAQQYPADQYNNYQQDNQAYPENYYEQQQQGYEGYNEQAEEHYQQSSDQYQAAKPEEQFYPEGQVDNREQQPKDQYPPNEQTTPSAGNYEQQAEQQSAPIPEQQVADNRPTDAQQENQDKESNKLQEESQQEKSKVEPEKPPSPQSNKAEGDRKSEAKSANSAKPDAAAEPTGEKPATKQPTKEKTADGKPEVKQTPAAAVKTAESGGGGTAKTTARAGDKKGGADAGGKSAGAAKTADGKPAVKKAGEKIGGLKGAAVAARTASKLQK